jgi:hypothetical protein
MESMQFDKYVALDILNRVHISIEHIEERSQPYHCGDDFLMSSTGVAILSLNQELSGMESMHSIKYIQCYIFIELHRFHPAQFLI